MCSPFTNWNPSKAWKGFFKAEVEAIDGDPNYRHLLLMLLNLTSGETGVTCGAIIIISILYNYVYLILTHAGSGGTMAHSVQYVFKGKHEEITN